MTIASPPNMLCQEPLAPSTAPVWRPSVPAASHAGSLASSERENPLMARNDFRLRHGEWGSKPKPSHTAGTAAFPLPFEVPQLPRAVAAPSTDQGSRDGGAQQNLPAQLPSRCCPEPSQAQLILPGFRASLWAVWLWHRDGPWEFWFRQAAGDAILRGRHGEGVLLEPGELRARGAGGDPGPPDSAVGRQRWGSDTGAKKKNLAERRGEEISH